MKRIAQTTIANGNAHATDGGEVFSPSNSNGKLRKKRILANATV